MWQRRYLKGQNGGNFANDISTGWKKWVYHQRNTCFETPILVEPSRKGKFDSIERVL